VAFDPYEWEAIDWDDPEDEDGNYFHCLQHDVDEVVVDEVLKERPVAIKLSPTQSDFVIAGPNAARNKLWTLLFDRSWKRGDWLRPVTGWESKTAEVRQWEKITHEIWRRGRNG
jgi:hypothetical protein